MKKFLLIILLATSTSVFAQSRQCAEMPGACGNSPPGLQFAPALQAAPALQKTPAADNFAQVPLPGTIALLALGLTGLIISRQRRKK